MSDTIFPLQVWPEGIAQASVPANENALRNEALRRPCLGVENSVADPADADLYIVGDSPADDFATFVENDLAFARVTDAGTTWHHWAPTDGLRVWMADGSQKVYVGESTNEWQDVAGGTPDWGDIGGTLSAQTDLQAALDAKADTSALAAVATSGDVGDLTGFPGGSTNFLREDGTFAAPPGGGGMTNPMTTAGDIIIGGASGTPTRLAAGTNTYVLTMVAGAPAWAAAGGGGGLTNFTEGVNSSSPNATVPVVYLNATNAATNVDIAICPKGTGAFSLQIADGTATGGNKRGAYAVDFQRVRASASQVGSGQYALLHGQNSIASGAHSVAVGQDLTVSGGGSAAIGGRYTNLSGTGCFAAAGQFIQLSANYCLGSGQYPTDRGVDTCRVIAGGCFSSNGDAQAQELVLRCSTTNATPTRATASISTGGTNAAAAANQFTMPNNSAYHILGRAVVRQQSTGEAASFPIDFLVTRGANAASTAIVGSPSFAQLFGTGGLSACTLSVSADTTIGCPAFTMTGETSKTLRWSIYAVAIQVTG